MVGDVPKETRLEQVTPPEQVTEVVPTPYTPLVPFETKRLLDAG